MEPSRGTVLLVFLGLVCLTGPALAFMCQAPVWNNTAGLNPFPALRGKVVLVALLKGYCGYCVHQAGRLNQLKNELINEGFPDVDVLIINGGEPRSRNLVHNLINASPLPVIQDTLDHVLYRQVFQGNKDDFLIYDRCNQASLYIPHPLSDLDKSITKRVIKYVQQGHHGCYCSLDYLPRDLDDMMQGDDPGVSTYQTHNVNRNTLQCGPNESECLLFERAMNTFPQRGRRGNRAFRRHLMSMRRRGQNPVAGSTRYGVLGRRRNQNQGSEERRGGQLGGGRGLAGRVSGGLGGGRRWERFRQRGNSRFQGVPRQRGNSRFQGVGRSQRVAGSV